MLGNLYQTPASTRPKYALDAPTTPTEGGNPLRKGVMLALMALAAGLFFVLPDGDDEVIAVSSADPETPAVTIPEAATTSSALQAVSSANETADDAATAQVAIATEAALTGAEHSLSSSLAISSMGRLMSEAQEAAAAADGSPSTTVSPAPVAPTPSTTATAAAETTEAPATTAADGSSTSQPTDSSTSSTDETATDTDETATDTDASTTTSSVADGSSSSSTPETTVPASTVPETTAAPETTVAQAGWLDSGYGVMLPKVLLDIRWCESRDRYDAANPSSSARGAYQFLSGSWAAYGHKDRYGVSTADQASPAQQDEAALITWERDGTRPWNASKSCWSGR